MSSRKYSAIARSFLGELTSRRDQCARIACAAAAPEAHVEGHAGPSATPAATPPPPLAALVDSALHASHNLEVLRRPHAGPAFLAAAACDGAGIAAWGLPIRMGWHAGLCGQSIGPRLIGGPPATATAAGAIRHSSSGGGGSRGGVKDWIGGGEDDGGDVGGALGGQRRRRGSDDAPRGGWPEGGPPLQGARRGSEESGGALGGQRRGRRNDDGAPRPPQRPPTGGWPDGGPPLHGERRGSDESVGHPRHVDHRPPRGASPPPQDGRPRSTGSRQVSEQGRRDGWLTEWPVGGPPSPGAGQRTHHGRETPPLPAAPSPSPLSQHHGREPLPLQGAPSSSSQRGSRGPPPPSSPPQAPFFPSRPRIASPSSSPFSSSPAIPANHLTVLISQCGDLSTLVHLVLDNSGGEQGGTNAKQYRRLRENPIPGTPPKPCIFNVIHASAALVTAARLIRAGTESATVISEQVPVLLRVAQRYC